MNKDKLKDIGCTSIEDLITEDFGALGTEERNAFEASCEAFIIGEQLKAERLKAGMTQEQLAAKSVQRKATSHALRTDIRIYNFLLCSESSKDWDEK